MEMEPRMRKQLPSVVEGTYEQSDYSCLSRLETPLLCRSGCIRFCSGRGLLAQRDNEGRLRPISFFSCQLNESQKCYSAGEREAWAIVAATHRRRECKGQSFGPPGKSG